MPFSLQPCMSSALPTGLEVMRTTGNVGQPRAHIVRNASLTLSLERDINLLEHLHRVRAAALLFGVVQDVALLRDGALDHVEEHGSERALHVRTDPDQEPVVELHCRREHRADAGARADRDAAPEEVREVGQPGELCDGALAGEAWVTQGGECLTFISRVYKNLGGSATRPRVQSPCTPAMM